MLYLKIRNFIDFANFGLAIEKEKRFSALGGSIGRKKSCDWILPDRDRKISGQHLKIESFSGEFYAIDQSTNGSMLNGQKLEQNAPVKLKQGDILKISSYEIIVVDTQAPEQKNQGFDDLFQETVPVSQQDSALDFLNEKSLSDNDPFESNQGASSGSFHTRDPYGHIPDHVSFNPMIPEKQLAAPKAKPQVSAEKHRPEIAMPDESEFKLPDDFFDDQPAEINTETTLPKGGFNPFEPPKAERQPEARQTPPKQTRQAPPNPPEHPKDIYSQKPDPVQTKPNRSIPDIEPDQEAYSDATYFSPKSNTPEPNQYREAPRPHTQPDPMDAIRQQASNANANANANAGDDAFLRLLCHKMKIDPGMLMQLDKAYLYSELADVISTSLNGIVKLMMERNAAKNKFNSDLTMFKPGVNNAIKVSVSAKQVLETMLYDRGQTFLKAQESIGEAVSEIQQHYRAVNKSSIEAVKELIETDFAPGQYEAKVVKNAKHKISKALFKADCWDMYVENYHRLTKQNGKILEKDYLTFMSEAYEKQGGGV